MRILYVVSTLASSGPTNQLYNIIKYLDRDSFEPYLVTLSPEPSESRWKDFQNLGVEFLSLNLSRIKGLFLAKARLASLINEIQPNVVHTQGLRADTLLASLNPHMPWVMTSRNFPPDDYLSKFGRFKGSLMVRQHFAAMRQCSHLVACSKSIMQKLADLGIQGRAIQNGACSVQGDADAVSDISQLPRPVFISVGSLIPRKNMQLLVNAFQALPIGTRGSLVILGDGPEMATLKQKAGKGIHLLGNVENVPDYLSAADFFISTSLSEGLPNTVLEALAAGLPVILSDIESHLEIARESTSACKIFSLQEGGKSLIACMEEVNTVFDSASNEDARRIAVEIFSAERMSTHYQNFYREILEDQ